MAAFEILRQLIPELTEALPQHEVVTRALRNALWLRDNVEADSWMLENQLAMSPRRCAELQAGKARTLARVARIADALDEYNPCQDLSHAELVEVIYHNPRHLDPRTGQPFQMVELPIAQPADIPGTEPDTRLTA